MIERQKKIALIAEISSNNTLQVVRNMIELINALIEEARAENDEADGPSMMRNQGKIKAYKTLLDYIVKGVPASTESTGINLT